MARYTGSSPSSLYADFLLDIYVKSQNVSANTTTLTYRLFFKAKGGGYPYSSTAYPLVFKSEGITVVSKSTAYNVPAGGEFTLHSGEFTVTHNSDGQMTLYLTATMGSHQGNCSLNGNMTLPTLAVKSTIKTMPSSCAVGSSFSVTIEKASTSFVHAVRMDIPTAYGTDSIMLSNYNDNLTTTSYTIPMAWLSDYMKKSSTLTTTIVLTTKSGTNVLGEDSRSLTVTVPATAKPTINSVTVVEKNTSLTSIFGASTYVQNLSNLELNINYTKYYDSEISTFQAKVNGNTFNSTTSTIAIGGVSTSGNVNIEITLTDNRGGKATTTKAINLLEYNPPEILLFAGNRKESPAEAECKLRIKHIATSPTDKNPCTIKVSQKVIGSSTWTEVYSATSNVSIFDQTIFLGSNFNLYDGYDLRVVATDKFKTTTALATLPSSDISMVFDTLTNSVGIGKFPTLAGRDGLDVEGEIWTNGEKVLSGNSDVFFKK